MNMCRRSVASMSSGLSRLVVPSALIHVRHLDLAVIALGELKDRVADETLEEAREITAGARLELVEGDQ
jgi:hypothetical protein